MNDNAAPAFSAGENGLVINEPVEPEKKDAIAPPKPAKPKNNRFIKLAIFIVVVGLVVFAATQVDYVAVVDNITATGYEPSEDMAALISELSLTEDGRRIMNATRPELQEAEQFNANCNNDKDASDSSSTLGCYSDGRIYVYNMTRSELNGIRQVTLAHEFLHAVWQRIGKSEQNALRESLNSACDANEDIRKHLELYGEDERLNELHSVVGTQISPNEMPEKLREHYAKYFSEHSKIAKYYNDYHAVFVEADNKIKTLKTQIAEHREKIQVMKSEYMAANAALSQDINDFNSRSRSGGFTSQEQFITERHALLDRQEAQRVAYQNLTDYISETNLLISEYNSSALRATDLYNSIDSNIKQPDSPTTE